jgi:hypothetical protein
MEFMPDAFRTALTGLRALAADHRSGAAEIAARAAALLDAFCREARPADPRLPYALGELAETALTVQPSLAPLLHLGNLIQLAAERDHQPLRTLRARLAEFQRRRQQAAARIARLLAARWPRATPKATVLT